MQVRMTPPLIYTSPANRVIQAGGGPSVPETPQTGQPPALPGEGVIKTGELMNALIHPLRTLRGLFDWSRSLLAFEMLGAVSTQNAEKAESYLTRAEQGVAASGLGRVLPFLSRAVNNRAAEALKQLRPSIEQDLSTRAMHPIYIGWPVGGPNVAAFQELMTFNRAFKECPDIVVQKALSGITEINVQRLDLWDMTHPVKRQAATLIVQRPIKWLPGQQSLGDSVRAYLAACGTVSVAI